MRSLNQYGPHSAKVVEVLDYACIGLVLTSGQSDRSLPKQTHFFDRLVIDDYAKAKELAFEAEFGSKQLLWKDIKELESSEVYSQGYATHIYPEFSEALASLYVPIYQCIQRVLTQDYQDIITTIVGDLVEIGANRAVTGGTGFYEAMFGIYKSGGWPCGWDGEYPHGRFISYEPSCSLTVLPESLDPKQGRFGTMIERVIETVCIELGVQCTGHRAIDVGVHGEETCPRVVFGTDRQMLQMFITDQGAVIYDQRGNMLKRYPGLSKTVFVKAMEERE